MKFLVTGGTGFIGQRVVQQLIKKNIEVIATDIILEEESNNLSNRIKDSKLKEIIAQVGATGPSDMGKVMGKASQAFKGQADGKRISSAVKSLLS